MKNMFMETFGHFRPPATDSPEEVPNVGHCRTLTGKRYPGYMPIILDMSGMTPANILSQNFNEEVLIVQLSYPRKEIPWIQECVFPGSIEGSDILFYFLYCMIQFVFEWGGIYI
jgi:hypothetical protein